MAATQERIVKTPETCGGRARIAGHRVRVMDIAIWHEHQGMSADEIVSHVPSLTLADVHAALAYYFDHVDEIQLEMQAEKDMVESLHSKHPSRLEIRTERS